MALGTRAADGAMSSATEAPPNNEMNPTKGVKEAGAPRPLLHQCALRGLFQCWTDQKAARE
jgi:hypothetical protein